VTGEATPANFAILLGPLWESQIPDLHKNARLEVLLCPPPESPAHMMGGFMDEGCPVWRPRGPSVEEEEQIRRVRHLSQVIAQSDAEAEAEEQ
jgi:hypothetical protein